MAPHAERPNVLLLQRAEDLRALGVDNVLKPQPFGGLDDDIDVCEAPGQRLGQQDAYGALADTRHADQNDVSPLAHVFSPLRQDHSRPTRRRVRQLTDCILIPPTFLNPKARPVVHLEAQRPRHFEAPGPGMIFFKPRAGRESSCRLPRWTRHLTGAIRGMNRRTLPSAGTGAVILVGLAAIVFAGCTPGTPVQPAKISFDPHASGNNQCGAYGELLAAPLKVAVFGPQEKGLLGGKGSRRAAPGVAVVFEVTGPDSGTVFEETGTSRAAVTADKGGSAAVHLRLGTVPGDVGIRATVQTDDGAKSVDFRATAGVERFMSAAEGATGGTIEAIGVVLTAPSGKPTPGITVFFSVEGDGEKADVGGKPLVKVVTDEGGRAATSWTLGQKVQQNFVTAEIQDDRPGITESERFHARAITFTAMATSKKALIIELFGGLAIFVFGMKLMSAGLQRMADRRLKAILQAMTRNRFLALAVGAGLTAMVQSSSATTVMTVGFVNAGLMTLTQAIGVVFGANIGTTVTGQIIAFKLDALAYPAIVVGLVLSMVSKRTFHKALGEAILGFGLLFLGMTTMSGILKPLRHSPEFVSLFQLFDCTPDAAGGLIKAPQAFMCILIGTAATVLIQSSSATVGLVLALSGQGLLSFYTALPLVLGDNIGTTITAILASLGANRNAKRAALAHTMFNVFGAMYMYVLLLIPLWNGRPLFLGFIDWLTPGDVFASTPENLPRHVANAHTMFNVFNVVLFVPFIPLMARIAKRIVPLTVADEEQILKYLEPNLLKSPSLAVRQAVKEVSYMLRRAQKSLNEACEFFDKGGQGLEEKVSAREELIDRLQHEITAYLVDVSQQELTPSEAALIPALIHAVNDAERVGDHSEDLLELGHLRREGKRELTADALQEAHRLLALLNEQFEAIYRALEAADPGEVMRVIKREGAITELMQAATEAHVARLEAGDCDVQSGVIFLDLLGHLERVGDHLLNIAERAGTVIQVMDGV
jgi:phosphate:Na+ symporter